MRSTIDIMEEFIDYLNDGGTDVSVARKLLSEICSTAYFTGAQDMVKSQQATLDKLELAVASAVSGSLD